ncbi:nuclear transport factor 2 family protein, partial [Phycicoccus jejuensis]|uniref:nuclear transport factor 2 family protein n=1 Tax=Phycicoccus jejuensis TaxID=367299 RepID=UPI0004C472A5
IRWLDAVRNGNVAKILADHAPDCVMFDVSPPEGGVRGTEAYSAAWRPFVQWMRGGAHFDPEELFVEAGDSVGFAWALIRCGTDEDLQRDPRRRLRLSFGLRRDVQGRWSIVHEHHSFTHS